MGPGYVLVLVGCVGNFLLEKSSHFLNFEVGMVFFTPNKIPCFIGLQKHKIDKE